MLGALGAWGRGGLGNDLGTKHFSGMLLFPKLCLDLLIGCGHLSQIIKMSHMKANSIAYN